MIVDPNIDAFRLGLEDDIISGWYNEATGELATHFPVGPDDVVLDLGCGDGGNARFCAQRGARLILTDIDAGKIAHVKKRLSAYSDLRLEAHVTDANPLPVADATATRVICAEVLEHVDDPTAIMAELMRIGCPGALYLLTVPATAQEKLQKSLAPPSYFERPNHIRVFEPESFADLVRSAGLTIEHTSSYGFFWAMRLLLFWQCDVPLSGEAHHPCLDSWTRTWAEVLNGKDGLRIKAALDQFMPRTQVIIARKPHATNGGETVQSLFERATHLADGAACDDQLLVALASEIADRLARAGLSDASVYPRMTDLRVRRAGLPDWWSEGKNLLLAEPTASVDLRQAFFQPPAKRAVVVMGQGSMLNHTNLAGDGPMVVLGDDVHLDGAAISGIGSSTVLIGEHSNAVGWAMVDSRNGGVVVVGPDGMWASGVNIMTDDSHAVRDLATGKRLNIRGGRIVIGQHVWLCADVRVLGDANIGSDSVVGMGSLVKKGVLPPNSILAGRPARVVRTGVTWSRQDLP